MGLLLSCIVVLRKDDEMLRRVNKHLKPKSGNQRALVVASKEAVSTSGGKTATIGQQG